MFNVGNVIISEDVALSKFACDLPRCKGACCVVGNAGAPVSKDEIPVLHKLYRKLKGELRPEAVEVAEKDGVVIGNEQKGYELACVGDAECIFVKYDENEVAYCAIQKAYMEGRVDWEKPISCHLFPVRIKKIAGFEYMNFEYVADLCSAACAKGKKEGVYLADFLKRPLERRYGADWYGDFLERCAEVRAKQ